MSALLPSSLNVQGSGQVSGCVAKLCQHRARGYRRRAASVCATFAGHEIQDEERRPSAEGQSCSRLVRSGADANTTTTDTHDRGPPEERQRHANMVKVPSWWCHSLLPRPPGATVCTRSPQSSISLPFVYPGTLSGLRIAIATLLVLNEGSPCGGSGCALLPWCASARRLQRELYQHAALSVTLLAVHANRNDAPTEGPATETCEHSLLSRATERLDPHDCPGLQLVRPTQRMMRLSRAHAARVIASGVMSYHPAKIRGMWPTLWKWELTRLHECMPHGARTLD